MGQRHQIYVVVKEKNKYTGIGAFHHQWCYGFRAALNAVRLQTVALKAKMAAFKEPKWESYNLRDRREVDVVVKAVYGIDPDGTVSMVHNENDHLIDDSGNIHPENGDNNDGAALLVIDNDLEQVRVCMFTPGHVEGSHGKSCKAWKAYSPRQYFAFYYSDAELAEGTSRAEDVKTIESCTNLVDQKEFNKIMKAAKAGGGE